MDDPVVEPPERAPRPPRRPDARLGGRGDPPHRLPKGADQRVSGVVSVVGEIASDPAHSVRHPAIGFGDALKALATAVAIGMVLVGALHLRRSRLAAYVWFKRAVLVSLLLTQFIAFYENVLTAAWALLLNLALLAALNWAIGRERAGGAGRTAAQPTAR